MTSIFALLNQLQPKSVGYILLYHSAFPQVPAALGDHVHNVTPDNLALQISWLKRHFDFCTVDELIQKPSRGKVAVTFDDAYASVFEYAQPVLEQLSVPFTVFVNGGTMQGVPFWRDLIRFILQQKWHAEFASHCQSQTGIQLPKDPDAFYTSTKSATINSRILHSALISFLQSKQVDLRSFCFCLESFKRLKPSPFLHLGNHSMNHYVLSSLDNDEQARELTQGRDWVQQSNQPLSQVFSIPFGGLKDFNPFTIQTLQQLGYQGAVLSRNRYSRHNPTASTPTVHQPFPLLERYMPPDSFKDFQKQLLEMWLRPDKD